MTTLRADDPQTPWEVWMSQKDTSRVILSPAEPSDIPHVEYKPTVSDGTETGLSQALDSNDICRVSIMPGTNMLPVIVGAGPGGDTNRIFVSQWKDGISVMTNSIKGFSSFVVDHLADYVATGSNTVKGAYNQVVATGYGISTNFSVDTGHHLGAVYSPGGSGTVGFVSSNIGGIFAGAAEAVTLDSKIRAWSKKIIWYLARIVAWAMCLGAGWGAVEELQRMTPSRHLITIVAGESVSTATRYANPVYVVGGIGLIAAAFAGLPITHYAGGFFKPTVTWMLDLPIQAGADVAWDMDLTQGWGIINQYADVVDAVGVCLAGFFWACILAATGKAGKWYLELSAA